MQRLILTMILLGAGCPALAQDALMRAEERARYLGDYQALLDHEQSTVRMAAVEEALAGDDVEVRSMAIESALSSDDERLHTTVIRWFIDTRSQISVTLILPERASEAQKYIYQKWNGLILKKPEVLGADEIKFKAGYGRGGQLVRGGMELNFNAGGAGVCKMTAKPASGTVLAGQFHCTFGGGVVKSVGADQAAIPVRIDIS